MVVLPSGSVIAAGFSNVYDGIPKTWAWLIKVDANGCNDTLCTVTGLEDLFVQAGDVNIYPNPFFTKLPHPFIISKTAPSFSAYSESKMVLIPARRQIYSVSMRAEVII